MRLKIEQFPMHLLDFMKSELARYANCTIEQVENDVLVSCDADVIKCMEVIVVADKFDFNSTNNLSSSNQHNPAPS